MGPRVESFVPKIRGRTSRDTVPLSRCYKQQRKAMSLFLPDRFYNIITMIPLLWCRYYGIVTMMPFTLFLWCRYNGTLYGNVTIILFMWFILYSYNDCTITRYRYYGIPLLCYCNYTVCRLTTVLMYLVHPYENDRKRNFL